MIQLKYIKESWNKHYLFIHSLLIFIFSDSAIKIHHLTEPGLLVTVNSVVWKLDITRVIVTWVSQN